MRSTWCTFVIVLAPACALTPASHEVSAPPSASPRDERPSEGRAERRDVPPDWRRPTHGARPWRAWQFVPDDARQRRRYDYDPERREYRFGEDRVVPEAPGERCPLDDLPRPLPDGEA